MLATCADFAQLWCALGGASVERIAATGRRRGTYLVRVRYSTFDQLEGQK